MEIKRIGIVGAGQMGNGIAHVFALAGFQALLTDQDPKASKRALEIIRANLDRQIAKNLIAEEEKVAALSRITLVDDYAPLADCELLIESVTEDEPTKRDVIRRMAEVANEEAILTSNTSTISITRLASVTGKPERFMGLHFMNPAPVMQLVELIRGHRDRRRDLPDRAGTRAPPRQDLDLRRGLPGFHRQSGAASDDQRSGLHLV